MFISNEKNPPTIKLRDKLEKEAEKFSLKVDCHLMPYCLHIECNVFGFTDYTDKHIQGTIYKNGKFEIGTSGSCGIDHYQPDLAMLYHSRIVTKIGEIIAFRKDNNTLINKLFKISKRVWHGK